MASTYQQAVDRIREWRKNPVRFVWDNFGVAMGPKWEGPDDWQHEALMALVTPTVSPRQRNIALKACKGPGKTCYEAWAIWWFLACFPHSKGLATSITGDNLRDNLWAELAKWQNMSEFLAATFQWNVERIFQKEHQATWFIAARQWAKGADSTEQANTLAGLHEDYTIVVIDEAGDIPSAVAAAIDASQSTGKLNIIIIAGNPSQTDGPLYNACTRDRALYKVIEITGDPDDPRRAKRIDINWARNEIRKWGRDSSWVMTNVLGQFPRLQSNKLLSLFDIEEATRRNPHPNATLHYPTIYGLDVARYGDNKSILVKRIGPTAFIMGEWREINTMDLCSQVAMVFFQEKGHARHVDVGGVGGGVVDRLNELGWEVMGVDSGGGAVDRRFANRRSEMWWEMADWVRKVGCIPHDEELRKQLGDPTYKWDEEKGKHSVFKLETKDDMRKRGILSPDKADALSLTFASKVAMLTPQGTRGVYPGAQALHDYDPLERAGA